MYIMRKISFLCSGFLWNRYDCVIKRRGLQRKAFDKKREKGSRDREK